MSNLVIGGVSLAKLSELEIRFLLQKAESLGIIEIDTAPSYGSSQEKIGKVGLSKSWKINSKVLSPSSRDANRHTVRASVENSLRELRIDQLNTVFVHSVRESEYKKEIHEELLLMKTEGKILNIGYSGDGRDLEEITSSFSFDAFQATLNLLDLSNFEFFNKQDSMNSYIKRPLSNQVFRIKPKLEIIDFLYRLKNSQGKDIQAYAARYQALFGSRIFGKLGAIDFLQFLLSLNLNSKIIVGVSKIHHLIELVQLENSFSNLDEATIHSHFQKWAKYARERNWEPLI